MFGFPNYFMLDSLRSLLSSLGDNSTMYQLIIDLNENVYSSYISVLSKIFFFSHDIFFWNFMEKKYTFTKFSSLFFVFPEF